MFQKLYRTACAGACCVHLRPAPPSSVTEEAPARLSKGKQPVPCLGVQTGSCWQAVPRCTTQVTCPHPALAASLVPEQPQTRRLPGDQLCSGPEQLELQAPTWLSSPLQCPSGARSAPLSCWCTGIPLHQSRASLSQEWEQRRGDGRQCMEE